MIYYKLPRPADKDFPRNKNRITFSLMLIPPINHATEKFCYAEIKPELFNAFLEEFIDYGGEILQNRKDFPDEGLNIIKGRMKPFTILTPR